MVGVRERQPERTQRVNAETNRESWCTDATERVDVPTTRRVRTCLSLSRKVINHPSLHAPTLSASFLHTNFHYSGGETREGSRNAAAIMSSPTSSPFADVIQSLTGLHQEHHQALLDMREGPRTSFLCPRPEPAGGPRAVPELDGPGGSGWGIPPAPALSTHMPLQKMGPQDDPEAFLDLFEKTAEACGWPQMNWPVRLIPLLSGEVQLAAKQLPVQKPPGLRWPEASHPPAGRPEPRTTSPALQIARAGGKRQALRDGSPAPGLRAADGPYHPYPKKSQPSPRRSDYTNLSHFRLGCSGRPLPFSASWTKSSDRTPHMPLPI